MTMNDIPMLRVRVDFQGGCEHGHLPLDHLRDPLKLLGKVLHNGLRIVIVDEVDEDDDGKPVFAEVQGSLLFDEKCQMWVAFPDWPEFSSPSDSPDQEEHVRVVNRVNAQIEEMYRS